MRTQNWLIQLVLSALIAMPAFAGWTDWTPVQKAAIKGWIKQQDTGDTVKLRNLITKKPIIGFDDWDEEVPRDKLTVLADREAKRIAALAGITKTDTPAEIDGKLKTYIDAAATVDKPLALYNASKFWTCYFRVRDVDGDQSDVIIVHHHDPIYGQSPAQVNGLGKVTGDDIEYAIRNH